jgi:DNA-binding CsgD family transcriptional regulator
MFLQNDILKISLLLPHLAAAVGRVSLQQKLHARQSIIDALADDLARPGVLMLDQTFRTVIANNYATQLLNGRPDEQIPSENIPLAIKQACNELQLQISNPGQRQKQTHIEVTFSIEGKPMHGMVRVDTLDKQILRFIVYFGSTRQNQLQPELIDKFGLSNREVDITQLVSFGLTNQELADRLRISVHTVENHLRSIYSKVEVHNRTSQVSQLIRNH